MPTPLIAAPPSSVTLSLLPVFLTRVESGELLQVVVGESVVVPSHAEVVADGEEHGGGVDVDGVHGDVNGDRESEITDWKTKRGRKRTGKAGVVERPEEDEREIKEETKTGMTKIYE